MILFIYLFIHSFMSCLANERRSDAIMQAAWDERKRSWDPNSIHDDI